jgi:hypothetical protein
MTAASTHPEDRLIAELAASIQGALRHSRLAPLVLGCCHRQASLSVVDSYAFDVLETAIREADESVVTADKLVGKVEGREASFRAVSLVLVALRNCIEEGRCLCQLMANVTEVILAMPEVAVDVHWHRDGQYELCGTVQWGDLAKIETLLASYCED